MRVVYLIGAPGAGKTTLTSTLRERFTVHAEVPKPVKHTQITDRGTDRLVYVELGWWRPPFGGTDSLAMNINPVAVEWIRTKPAPVVLGEGDRLANRRFLEAAADAGDLTVAWLDVPADLAYERRARRAAAHGLGMQTGSWVAGRVTKTDNLVAELPVTRIDGTAPAREQADQLADLLGLTP